MSGVRPPDPRAEVDEELAFHLERTVADLVARGWAPAEARAEARRRFGDLEHYRLRLGHIQRRRRTMRRGREILGTLTRSLRLAARSLARRPGFTLTVVLTLALGIGANATMFEVVDRLMLQPPPHVEDAAGLRRIYMDRERFNGERLTSPGLTLPDVRDVPGLPGVAGAAAYTLPEPRMMRVPGGSRVEARLATADPELFGLLGVEPLAGRFPAPDDAVVGATPTAVLSHGFWERRLGGDPGVLGSSVTVDGTPYVVVGVAPPDFTGAELAPVDLWIPLEAAALADGNEFCMQSRNCWWVRGVVRLDPGATDQALEDAGTARVRAARQDDDEPAADLRVVLGPLQAARGPVPSEESRVAGWLAGVSVLVLLIACANVASVLLSRLSRRRRELAVRTALGVGRGRLLVELLAEAVVLSAMGTAVALALAVWAGAALRRMLLAEVHFPGGLSPRLLLFALVAAVITTVLAGLGPALRASRRATADALRDGAGAGARDTGVRRGLLVAQAAFSVALLVGAGLFVRSFLAARDLDLGWDRHRVALVRLEFDDGLAGVERETVYRRVADRLAGLGRVEAVSATYTVPFRSSIAVQVADPGRDSLPPLHTGGPYVNIVDGSYFEAMGIRLERGRTLESARGTEDAPREMVVSRTLARVYWPDRDPLGQCLLIGGSEGCTRVVGIVEDHRREELEEVETGLYYLPFGHPDVTAPPQGLMVRARGPASTAAGHVREALAGIDPRVRWTEVVPLEDLVAPALRSWRLGATMFAVFGGLALLVAAVGLYGALAFDVSRRVRELGVRSALGATAGRLVGMVLRDGLLLTAAGIAAGLILAGLAGRWLAPRLFHVSPWDPVVYGGVAALLLAVAVLAASIPAWRTTRLDPTEALRSD